MVGQWSSDWNWAHNLKLDSTVWSTYLTCSVWSNSHIFAGVCAVADAGGDGQHDGQRDDSIGLAYAHTHGYAGLRSKLGTGAITVNLSTLHDSSAVALHNMTWEVLASFGDSALHGDLETSLHVRPVLLAASHTSQFKLMTANSVGFVDVYHGAHRSSTTGASKPQWLSIVFPPNTMASSSGKSRLFGLEFRCKGDCTLFAVRSLGAA